MVTQLPDKDETSFSRKQMLARLDVCMGGRVAEELVFGEGEVRGVPILLSSSLLSIYTVISCLLFFFVFTMMEHFGIAHNDIFRHC
jgi:hypothetical protein